MPLFVREQEVEKLLPMGQALVLVEDALRTLAQAGAMNRPRARVRGDAGILHIMPAAISGLGFMGFKAYTSFHGKTQFYVHIFDVHTGEYLAIIQGNRLGQVRTGAASGVATKYLARQDAQTAGIIGTGWQAESQLEAVCAVRRIRVARCYSRQVEHRRAFSEKMTIKLGIQVAPVDDVRDAVFDSDVVITATDSATPVMSGDWLTKGSHINAIGSNWPERRELDDKAIRRSGAIFVDSLEQAKQEAGDLIAPVGNGTLTWDRVRELGEVLAGKVEGREHLDEITLFKSLGIGLEDVAVGGWVYQKASEAKLGEPLRF
jgi:alanine dehydrogenase